MKTKNRIWIYSLLIAGSVLAFANSCKKDEDSNNNNSSGIVFNPDLTYGTMTDIDGNVYKTIQIGTQIWMAENLKTTRYNDDAGIPLVTDNLLWSNLTSPGYCWYDNDETTNKAAYGALYNWYAVNTGILCPAGWHVPSDIIDAAEWTILATYLGGVEVAGSKLKETGTTHWHSPNNDATNESGFTALPGGSRNSLGVFETIGSAGWWWSSTHMPAEGSSFCRYIVFGTGLFPFLNAPDNYGLSVRCLKDNM